MPGNHTSGAAKRRRRREAGVVDLAASRVAERRRSQARGERNRRMLDAIKVAAGCADCGYNDHPVALEFDHLPGFDKVDTIARMASGSRARLLREIGKCEVVCSNCHQLRTWRRRWSDG